MPKNTKNAKFIGPLTRFKKIEMERKYDLAVLLSGPEPQRSILEKLIIDQVEDLPVKTIIIQGKTESLERSKEGKLEIVSYLKGDELNEILMASDIVIGRSGYSTIMDLLALGKKAILIPTPGQTEQEYLAELFHKRRVFYTVDQEDFNLKDALEKVSEFNPGNFHPKSHVPLEVTISEFVDKIRSGK
jgi:uncharacterized protein (TIGR00661 family)